MSPPLTLTFVSSLPGDDMVFGRPQLPHAKLLKQNYGDISDKQYTVITLYDYQRPRCLVYKSFLPNKFEHCIYLIMCIFILRASKG